MTNYRNSDVIRLIGINSVDDITSDKDFQIGTITMEVGPKVRVVWNYTDTPEYVDKANLSKVDNRNFVLKTDMSSLQDNMSGQGDVHHITGTEHKTGVAQNSDESDKTDIAQVDVSTELKTDESVKPVKATRTRRSTAKVA